MKPLVDSHLMREIDETTQSHFGIPAIVLMERASLAVAEAVKKIADGENHARILSVCGIGNNGGDGVAAARILHEWGYDSHVVIVGDMEHSSELLRRQLQIAENCGVPVCCDVPASEEYTIVIDAIFGIGLTRAVTGVYAEWIQWINASGAYVVAVDVPSGVNTDNGRVESVAVKADQTITFGVDKIGLQLYPGREHAGLVQVADIGFPKKWTDQLVYPAFQYEPIDLGMRPERIASGNKGTFGKVLVIAGSQTMSGACYLSAAAAFRAGAGMVKILTVEENRAALQRLLPEAMITTWDGRRLMEQEKSEEQERIRREMAWADAIVVGPGLSRSKEAGALVNTVLELADVPVVIDADALYHVSNNPVYVRKQEEMPQLNLKKNWILTPHMKEMADFLGCSVQMIQKDPVKLVREISSVQQAVLVLKDARTLTAVDNKLCINASGNSGMATAGSGDVLTGVIAALLGQGMNCFEAASLGVYLHGLAGDVAAEECGREACMAGDIIRGLMQVQRNWERR